jgi:hypothetical protein
MVTGFGRSADGLENIDEVMADLVEPLARFEPRLGKIAPMGEPRKTEGARPACR